MRQESEQWQAAVGAHAHAHQSRLYEIFTRQWEKKKKKLGPRTKQPPNALVDGLEDLAAIGAEVACARRQAFVRGFALTNLRDAIASRQAPPYQHSPKREPRESGRGGTAFAPDDGAEANDEHESQREEPACPES